MVPKNKRGISRRAFLKASGAATLVQTPKMRNLQPAIFSMVGRYSTNWPALTAALTISVVPIIIVYIFMQRQFVAGLTAGAVRG
jgi:ABC-type glycerol-3-phosphate transport system permease component